jgi:flagellar biogenesis protein FliO
MEALQNAMGPNPVWTLLLIFVVLTIAVVLLTWLFRKIAGGNSIKTNRSRQPRLSVTDAAIVDDKRRLVLVRRDNVEHLVMIGGPSDIVIEQNISRLPAPAQQQNREPTPMREQPIVVREPAAAPSESSPSSASALQRIRQATSRPKREAAMPENTRPNGQLTKGRSAAGIEAGAIATAAAVTPEEASRYSEPLVAARNEQPLEQPAPYVNGQAEPQEADFEFDLAGELERDLEPALAKEAPMAFDEAPAAHGDEFSEDLDFAKMLSEPEAGPAITTPVPAARPAQKGRQETIDDEMQRLLNELSNA